MTNNSYDDFKYGIKKDVNRFFTNSFGAIGAFLLFFAIFIVFYHVFNKANQFSLSTKVSTGIGLAILIALLVFSKRVANAIYLGWLCMLVVVFSLIMTGICLGIIYLLGKDLFKGFF